MKKKTDYRIWIIMASLLPFMGPVGATPGVAPRTSQPTEAPKQTPDRKPFGTEPIIPFVQGTLFEEASEMTSIREILRREHIFEQGTAAVGIQPVVGKLFEEAQAGRTPLQVVAESRKSAEAPNMTGVAGSRFLAAIR